MTTGYDQQYVPQEEPSALQAYFAQGASQPQAGQWSYPQAQPVAEAPTGADWYTQAAQQYQAPAGGQYDGVTHSNFMGGGTVDEPTATGQDASMQLPKPEDD
jgi:hypothetical protein